MGCVGVAHAGAGQRGCSCGFLACIPRLLLRPNCAQSLSHMFLFWYVALLRSKAWAWLRKDPACERVRVVCEVVVPATKVVGISS